MIEALRAVGSRHLDSPALRLLAQSVWSRKRALAAPLLANAVAALVEGLSLVFLGLAVAVLVDGRLPGAMTHVRGASWLPQDSSSLFLCLIVMAVGSQILRSGLGFLGNISSVHLGTDVRVEFQMEITRRMLGAPFGVAQSQRGGDLAEALIAPSNTIVELIDAGNRLLVYLMMVGVYGVMLLWLAPGLTVLAIGIFAAVIYVQRHLMASVRTAATIAADDAAKMTANVVEQTQALRTIHIFSLQARLLETSRRIFGRMKESNRRLNGQYFGTQAINESAMLLAIGAFLILAFFSFRGTATFPLANFVTFIAVLNRLSARCSALQTSYSDIARRVGLMTRADDLLRNIGTQHVHHEGVPLPAFARDITFEHVSMRYVGRSEDALQGMSFRVAQGEAIGLVGESGAGKSTLADLLLGLYEPITGTIRIDGVDLRTVDLRSWTGQIATVSQDPFLFHGTIRDNLLIVRPDVTTAQMESALRAAGAWEFVQAMPEKERTVVGDRGLKLSGGQRQRLALARALICEPAVLLLDEATSALDSETEHAVQQALEKLRGRLTLIIIAHRLATLRFCDRLIVIQDGKKVEEGSHEVLMEQQGRYAAFWRRQSTAALANA